MKGYDLVIFKGINYGLFIFERVGKILLVVIRVCVLSLGVDKVIFLKYCLFL